MSRRSQPRASSELLKELVQPRLSYLLDNIQEFSAIVDRSGTVLYRNRTPRTPAVVVGSNIDDAVRPDCRDVMGATRQHAFQTGEVQSCEVVSRSSGYPYRVRLVPIVENDQTIAVVMVAAEIFAEKRAEKALRESQQELTIRNKIVDIFLTIPDEGMYGEVLHVVLEATQSKHGVFGYINENGDLVCPSMTREIWDQCQVPDKDIVFPRADWGGVWGRALRQKKLIGSNRPLRVPEGHIPVCRALAASVVHHGQLIGLLLVANKATDYDRRDRTLVRTIAQSIAPILHARLQRDRREAERVRVEKALRKSEAKYREVFEHVRDVFYQADMNGVFTEVSPSVEWWGYSPQQLIGARVADVYEDPEQRSAFLSALLEQGRVTDYEVRLKTGDGHVMDASVSGRLLRDQDGAMIGIEGVARDITRRKRAALAIYQAQERLRTVVANAPVVIFAITAEGVFELAEGKAVSLVGLNPEEHIGRSVFEMYRDMPGVIDAARRALAGETFTTVVETAERVFEAYVSPVREPDGAITGAVAVASDITERRQAERSLHESEERFRRLSDATNEGICIYDGGVILEANPQAAVMMGYEDREIIGRHVLDFVAPESRDLVLQHIAAGYEQPYEALLLKKDGTTLPAEVCGKPILYQGRLVRLGAFRDITERKQAEEALQRAREELEARVERQIERGRAYSMTFRELTVLHLVAAGKADKEIGRELGISSRTVSKHIESILKKMGAASRTEAGVRAVREELVQTSE